MTCAVLPLLRRGAGGEAERLHAAQQLFEEHPDLQAGECRAQAEVGAEPEGDVRVGVAGHVEALGVREVGRVDGRARGGTRRWRNTQGCYAQ